MRKLLFLLTFTFLLYGCQSAEESEQVISPAESNRFTNEAIQDLANRLKVAQGQIMLVREEPVTWRNSSLGCPKEGMMYTQALVEGSLIVLRVDGKNYQYHSGKGRAPFLCENPEKPAGAQNTKAKSSLE